MKIKVSEARRSRPDMQDYANQRYIAHTLDEKTFDALSDTDCPLFLYHDGALDAPDFMPAGSMKSVDGSYFDRSTVERGVSLKEQEEIDTWLDKFLLNRRN